jgi:endonuclease G, mitochondrial
MKSIQPILFWIFIFGLSTSPALFSLSNDTIVIYHKYHSTIFSKSKHFPVVVKYWLTRAMLDCEHRFKRANQFMPDPLIPEFSNLDNDYKHSGYDRGYQMDAYNCVCDSVVIIESFFYSNVAPQSTALNRCNWKHLEEYIRRLVKEYDSVLVWCGSVSLNDKHIGRVAVPDFCWEALYYI